MTCGAIRRPLMSWPATSAAAKSVQLVSSFAYDPSTWVSLTGGLRGHAGRTTCFRRLDDLLGAAYLTDIDPYLIDDRYFGDRLQNDLRRPGRRVAEGEAYGYFYDLDYVRLECWLLVRLRRRNRPRWSGYAGLQAAGSDSRATGAMKRSCMPGGLRSAVPSRCASPTGRSRRASDTVFRPVTVWRSIWPAAGGRRWPATRSCRPAIATRRFPGSVRNVS